MSAKDGEDGQMLYSIFFILLVLTAFSPFLAPMDTMGTVGAAPSLQAKGSINLYDDNVPPTTNTPTGDAGPLYVQGRVVDLQGHLVSNVSYEANARGTSTSTGGFNVSVRPGDRVRFASQTAGLSAEFTVTGGSRGARITLDSYEDNPKPTPPPGQVLRIVEVHADRLNYSEVEITIEYPEAEVNEETLQIYHYVNGSWVGMPTTVDTANNTVTTTAKSLSTFAVTDPKNWRFKFDSSWNQPYHEVGTWNPKVWLYNQNEQLISGANVSYSVRCANDETTLASGTAMDGGDGSYNATFSISSTHSGHYIEVRFSAPAATGQNLTVRRTYYVDTAAASNGLPSRIRWTNATEGPTFKNTSKEVMVELYSDAGVLVKNKDLTLDVYNSTGTAIVSGASMTDNGDGTYSYNMTQSTTSGEDYLFHVYVVEPIPGTWRGGYEYVHVDSDRYMRATQYDYNPPDIWDVHTSPRFPSDGQNITIKAHVADDIGLESVKVYYMCPSIDDQWHNKTMSNTQGDIYEADIGQYVMEDHITYYIYAEDTNTTPNTAQTSNYTVTVFPPPGAPATAWAYLDQNTYMFAKKVNNETDYDGDNVIFPYLTTANGTAWEQRIIEKNTIRATVLVLDDDGKPISDMNLSNLNVWITNDNGERIVVNGSNITELGDGRYLAVFPGSKKADGTYDDPYYGPRMWGKFTSGQIYYLNVSIDGDFTPETQVRWLAYTYTDAYYYYHAADADNPQSHCENNGCDPSSTDPHVPSSGGGGGGSASHWATNNSVSSTDPTCQECHGYYDITGGPEDNTRGAVHPWPNVTGEYVDCINDNCHGDRSVWDPTTDNNPPADMPVPGYPAGTWNITAESYDPGVCGVCHYYPSGVVPPFDGHNSLVGCKFCHQDYHIIRDSGDYNNTTHTGTPGYASIYPGDCYRDCHQTQEKHSGVVDCDECHVAEIEREPNHEADLGPRPGYDTCGICHNDPTYEYAGETPPQQPDPIQHGNGSTWSGAMGYDRAYWYDYEYSCRYCHGRTYDDNPALGWPLQFKGNNTQGQEVGNGTWCISCHWDEYVSGNHTYDDMVRVYNNTFGRIPPEISGNASYAPTSDPDYDNHTKKYGLDQTNCTDKWCMRCHGAHLNASSSVDEFVHNVSLDTYPPYVDSWNQTPNDVQGNTSNTIEIEVVVSDGIGCGVNTSVDPVLTWWINDTSGNTTNSGTIPMSYQGGTTWNATVTVNWSVHVNETLWYNVSGMMDNLENEGTSDDRSDLIQNASNEPPSTPELTYPVGGETLSGPIDVTWNASSDDGLTPYNITYYLDTSTDNGSSWSSLGSTESTTYQWNTTGTTDSHLARLRIRAYDGAEYSPYDSSNNFTVDNNAPSITSVYQYPGDVTDATNDSILVQVTLNDTASGINASQVPHLYWRINNGSDPAWNDSGEMTLSGDTWEGSIPQRDYQNDDDKTLQYYVGTYGDNAGNTGESAVYHDVIEGVEGISEMRVVTNRPVILDDPNSGKAGGGGFNTPPSSWGSDHWNNESTTIRLYALVIGTNGTPLSNHNVTFTIYYPNGSQYYTTTNTTNSVGIASASKDMNDLDYYGYYTVEANATESGETTTVTTQYIYNWWGCAMCHGDKTEPWASTTTASSPYLDGRDPVVGRNRAHQDHTRRGFPDSKCTHCHQSYDGLPGGSTSATYSWYPAGFHDGRKLCYECHGDYSQHSSDQLVPSCSGCHGGQNNELVSMKSTKSGNLSVYSGDPSTPLKYHSFSSDVPCILCHEAMHNITTPYPGGRGNNVTEDEHCRECHAVRKDHNGTVQCTVCHSQDAHAIQLAQGDGTYGTSTVNSIGCVDCHQGTADWNNLMGQSEVGSYSGDGPPQVNNPAYHSQDNGGQKWGDYWNTQQGACDYCHGDTKHKVKPLGNVDPLSTITNDLSGDNCVQCHRNTSSMYSILMGNLAKKPPEITNTSLYNVNDSFVDHSTVSNTTDGNCGYCHGDHENPPSNVSALVHNIQYYECTGCHYDFSYLDSGNKEEYYVNSTMYNASVHGTLKCRDCHVKGHGEEIYRKPCEACHVFQEDPVNETDRHNVTSDPRNYTVNGNYVLDIIDCKSCHPANTFDNAVKNFGPNGCSYCHTNPDQVYE